MTEEERDKAKAAAVASVGAGVGSAGGATVGVLETCRPGGSDRAIGGLGDRARSRRWSRYRVRDLPSPSSRLVTVRSALP